MLGHHNSHNRVSNTLAKKREPSKYMIKIFILQWAMQLHVLHKAINKQIINHNTINLYFYKRKELHLYYNNYATNNYDTNKQLINTGCYNKTYHYLNS